MNLAYVQVSGESLELARAEVEAAVGVLGGEAPDEPGLPATLVPVVGLAGERVRELAARLALAYRCLVVAAEPGRVPEVPGPGLSASFRALGRPTGGAADPRIRAAADAWKSGGGRIDLRHPDRRFWLLEPEGRVGAWLEEVAVVDRRGTAARSISALPFRRPIGLAPRLARAAANLARAAPGRRIVDPFLGTGALLAEAALLGARVSGMDRDAGMVRGALQNFQFLGVTAEALVVGDASAEALPGDPEPFDALLTDPPYGRASPTGGEAPSALLDRVLPRWAGRVREDGVLVVVVPGGPDPPLPGWHRVRSVPVRVHRSLTREFRVYARSP